MPNASIQVDSFHRAPRASPERAAVRTMNSNARADTPDLCPSACMKAGICCHGSAGSHQAPPSRVSEGACRGVLSNARDSHQSAIPVPCTSPGCSRCGRARALGSFVLGLPNRPQYTHDLRRLNSRHVHVTDDGIRKRFETLAPLIGMLCVFLQPGLVCTDVHRRSVISPPACCLPHARPSFTARFDAIAPISA